MTRARDVADTQDNLGGAVAPYVAGKNKIINGDFFVNQRAFSSSTSAGYYFDRWYGNLNTGTVTYSASTFTPGAAPVAGYEGRNFLTVATSGQSVAGAFTFFLQKMEDVRTFANQTVTISFWAKAASGTPKVAVEFQQDFGSGGSPSAGVNTYINNTAITTSWARYTITGTIPSISGKTIGTTANTSFLQLNFWVSAGSTFDSRTGSIGVQNNTIDLWGLQLESGSVATPFTTASGSIGGELALCQRYFEMSYDQATAPGTNTGEANGNFCSALTVASTALRTAYVPFKVPKRVTPTTTHYDLAGSVGLVSYVNIGSAPTNGKSAGSSYASQNGFQVYINNGDSTVGFEFQYTASAEL
jgi:hypothetical protein